MLHIKNKIFCFWTIFVLFSSICLGTQPQIDNKAETTKVYVDPSTVFFQDGQLLISEGQNLLRVKTLHQDSIGIYYDHHWLWGFCPNGHPYTPDGGCLGIGCPFSD